MPAFNHFDLVLPNPSFDSPLVDVLTELEHLRRLELGGTTPAPVFFQLKAIFHMLESLGSARIEGNHTTLADYVESKLEGTQQAPSDQLREMENIESAMSYIEDSISSGEELTELFIRELHAIAVKDLVREGDITPGAYRKTNVTIAQSEHLPPLVGYTHLAMVMGVWCVCSLMRYLLSSALMLRLAAECLTQLQYFAMIEMFIMQC
ncbi:MAG: hypothetical protein ABL859_01695 [Methylotenera sp.]